MRLAGVALLVCATVLAVLPALDWYSAAVPGGRVSVTGLGVSGALWLVPALSAAIALAGAALAAATPARRGRVGRWTGPAALAAALLALAAALWAGTDAEVVVLVSGENVAGPLAVPLQREAASWLAATAAMVAAGVGLVVSVAAWRP